MDVSVLQENFIYKDLVMSQVWSRDHDLLTPALELNFNNLWSMVDGYTVRKPSKGNGPKGR